MLKDILISNGSTGTGLVSVSRLVPAAEPCAGATFMVRLRRLTVVSCWFLLFLFCLYS
jgi:hypothetical protein